MLDPKTTNPLADMRTRAGAIRAAGSLERALDKGLQKVIEVTLSEALVLGLLKQGVRKYFAIFGHGSTDLGNVLRIYEQEGATRTINCRNEVELAIRRTLRGGDVDRPRCHAGLCRFARRRIERHRRLSHLR